MVALPNVGCFLRLEFPLFPSLGIKGKSGLPENSFNFTICTEIITVRQRDSSDSPNHALVADCCQPGLLL